MKTPLQGSASSTSPRSIRVVAKSFSVFSQSIRRKIVGVALGLIILMMVTSALSIVMSAQVGHLLDELTNRYIAFNAVLETSPGDGPSLALLSRIDQLAANPSPDWDGVWQMEHK